MVIRLHPKLELVINIEVDVILFLLRERFIAEHHPGGVRSLSRLLNRLFHHRFLDLWLLQVGEAARHQVIFIILLRWSLGLSLTLILILLLSLLEWSIVV